MRVPDSQYTLGWVATAILRWPPQEEVGVDLPAVRLGRGKTRDPLRWVLSERVKHGRGAEERQAEGVGAGGGGTGDDAVVFPGQRRHAQPAEFFRGRDGPLRVSGGVPDHQLQWPPGDPAVLVDVGCGQLESGEQVPAVDPAGPGQRDERADLDS